MINLDRRPDRLDAFARAWPYSREGLTRVAAVDGRALGPADVGRLRLFKADKRGSLEYPVGHVGAALSHLAVWRAVVAAGEAHVARALVFEDDCRFSVDDFAAAWAAPSFLRCSSRRRSWARARCRVSNASMASFKVCVAACAARAEASLASSTGCCAAATSAATTSGGMNRIRASAVRLPGAVLACGSLVR